MTIEHLAYRFAHEFNGGAVALAVLMAKNPKILQNKLNPNNPQHLLSADEFEVMTEFTARNFEAAEYFAAKCNAVVMQMPELPESDMEILDLFMSAMKELGEVSSAFQVAYADGDICAKDFIRISKEIDDVLAKLLEFKAAIKRVVR